MDVLKGMQLEKKLSKIENETPVSVPIRIEKNRQLKTAAQKLRNLYKSAVTTNTSSVVMNI